MVANGGSEVRAFRKQKYSEAYIKSGKIKSTRSWKIVSEEKLPNDLLADVNLGLLKHRSWQARNQGLDKAYKAKKVYTNGTEINIDTRSKDEVVESIIRRLEGNR